MAKIRILVVDDAVVFRRLVADELNADPSCTAFLVQQL